MSLNIFFLDYYARLREWHSLKQLLSDQPDIETTCVEVDKFWQKCPLLNHYLHVDDIQDWPSPWQLLSDNNYCTYARGLGMVYTLLQLGIKDIDFVEVLDDNDECFVLVVVNNNYILNYWPDSVLNTQLSAFRVTRKLDMTILKQKTGEDD